MPWRRFGDLCLQYDGHGAVVTRVVEHGPGNWGRAIRDVYKTWIEDGTYPSLDEAKAGPVEERRAKACKKTIADRRARQLRPDVDWSAGAWSRKEMGGIARRA